MADLSPVEPVTDEDKACGMDRRARLFKAATWEGLKMTAKDERASIRTMPTGQDGANAHRQEKVSLLPGCAKARK